MEDEVEEIKKIQEYGKSIHIKYNKSYFTNQQLSKEKRKI
jgi:hypothetical protein